MSDATSKPEGHLGRSKIALALGAVAGLVVLGVLCARVARVYPVSSDDATGVLEAASILEGNLLLRGWTVSNISFAATDLPFYLAGVAVRGIDPALLREVPAAVYAVAFGLAVALAVSGTSRKLLAATILAVLIGLPAGGLAEFMIKGYTRVGTSIGLLAALLALGSGAGRKVSPARLAAFTTIAALTLFSDTYFLVVGVAPILIVCAVGAWRKESYENLGLGRIALATCLAGLLAHGIMWLVHALGGFESEPLPLRDYLNARDPLGMLRANATALWNYLPALYRVDLPEVQGLLGHSVRLACLLGPVLLLVAFLRSAPWRHRRGRRDLVNDVLRVSLVLGLAAFLASANEKDKGTLRYMVPFVLSGAVLTGRVLSEPTRRTRRVAVSAALAVLAVAYATTIVWDLGKPPAPDPAKELAGWLEQEGLTQGYGPYWDASLVTVHGRGKVAVRPVRGRPVGPGRLAIEPFRWMSDDAWYRREPATFVVYRPDPGPKYHFLINEAICSACFGPPSRQTVGPFVVLQWGRDLRPLLVTDLPWVP